MGCGATAAKFAKEERARQAANERFVIDICRRIYFFMCLSLGDPCDEAGAGESYADVADWFDRGVRKHFEARDDGAFEPWELNFLSAVSDLAGKSFVKRLKKLDEVSADSAEEVCSWFALFLRTWFSKKEVAFDGSVFGAKAAKKVVDDAVAFAHKVQAQKEGKAQELPPAFSAGGAFAGAAILVSSAQKATTNF